MQIAFSQAGALFLFWLASRELPKADFGLFNWYFAIYGTLAAVFSFGFDFIVIRRISAKNDLDAARIQLLQTLIIFIITSVPLLLLMISGTLPSLVKNSLFILVAFQCSFLGMPFKNALTGRELFSESARAVIASNSLKIILMLILWLTKNINLQSVSIVLAISNFSELIMYFVRSWPVFERKLFLVKPDFKSYKHILKESLPQMGVILFDSAFARIDWILIGIISAGNVAVNTAEYSFAYKVFEVSRLPMLILAPILFTRFSHLFHNSQKISGGVTEGVFSFFKLELVLGMMIPLVLNFAWVPLMELFTSGAYGQGNHLIYFLLSLTIPLMYMINFLWTMAFAQGQLKLTMILSLVNSVLNILLNLILIPRYGQTGAAIAFLACNLVMLPTYIYFVKQDVIKFPLRQCMVILASAGVAAGLVLTGALNPWIGSVATIILFVIIIYSFKILTFAELKSIKHFITKE